MSETSSAVVLHPKEKTGVLTLIGISKLFEAVFLFLVVLEARRHLHDNVAEKVREWAEHVHLDPNGKYLRKLLASLLSVDEKKLRALGVVALIYFALHLTEGIGLLLHKRWAEYFTVISTSLLVPLEIYEIFHRISPTKVIVLLLNVAIVAYLIYRLVKTARTERQSEKSTPPLPTATADSSEL